MTAYYVCAEPRPESEPKPVSPVLEVHLHEGALEQPPRGEAAAILRFSEQSAVAFQGLIRELLEDLPNFRDSIPLNPGLEKKTLVLSIPARVEVVPRNAHRHLNPKAAEGATERARSEERRRLAGLLDDAHRLLALHRAEIHANAKLARPIDDLLPQLARAVADPEAQRVLPPPAGWYDERDQLRSLLRVAAAFIREHLAESRPGVPGARAAEICEAVDKLLHLSQNGNHMARTRPAGDDS